MSTRIPREVLEEAGRIVNEIAIGFAAFLADHVHHRMPFRLVVAAVMRHCRCQCYRARHLLEGSERNAPETIFLVDDLALLGDAQPAVDRTGRCTEYGNVSLAAAAADRSATPVEQHEFDVP